MVFCFPSLLTLLSDTKLHYFKSQYKRLLILVTILTAIFSLFLIYTSPVNSKIYTTASIHQQVILSSSPSLDWNKSIINTTYGSETTFEVEIGSSTNVADDFYYANQQKLHRLRISGTQRRLPSALIIGVRKCGTRALLEMLNLHPSVRKRDSEAHFFDDDNRYLKGIEWYRRKMPYSFDSQVTIEKTPSYFVSREAPARIHAMNESIRLLLIVRDPAVRVLSDYAQIKESKRAKGVNFKPFHKLVLLPNGEVNDRYNAVQISQYVVHILRWLRVFSREQLHIVDGDRLIQNPYPEIRKVEKFLNLPPKIQSSNFYYNRTKGFYCMRNETHHKCLADSKGRRHPYVDPTLLERLRRYFAPFNEQFYQIIGQNFSWPTS